MSGLQKILVVDHGARSADHALSMELAELGYASVTASLEATDEVLGQISAPSAVLLQMPRRQTVEHARFVSLAERLRASGYPVILVETVGGGSTGYASLLESQIGAGALNRPEL